MLIELVLSFRVIPAYPLVFPLQDSCWLDLCHSFSPLPPPRHHFTPYLSLSLFLSVSQFTSPTPTPPNSLFHQCLDGSAFSIIYRAFKSLTSCAVCKSPGLVCAQQLTLWIKQRWYATCDRKGFSKMGREPGSKRKKNKKRSHSPPQS